MTKGCIILRAFKSELRDWPTRMASGGSRDRSAACTSLSLPIHNHSINRIWDVYPGSWFLPIPDPGPKNSNKRERWKKNCCHNFLCSHKFHKIESAEEKNFQRILELFTQKIVTKALKNMGLEGSGIPKKPIPDPGSKGQKGPGSRIRIRNTKFQLYSWT